MNASSINPSIRGTLTRLLVTSITPLVIIVGGAVFLFVRTALLARVDDGLHARASALAAMLATAASGVEFDYNGATMPLYEQADSGEYFEVWLLDRREQPLLVERSKSLANRALPLSKSKLFDAASNSLVGKIGPGKTTDATLAATVDGNGAVSVRIHTLAVTPPESTEDEPEAAERGKPEPSKNLASASPVAHRVLVAVAQSRFELDRTLTLLATTMCIAAATLVGGVLLAVGSALSRGLAPLDELASQVQLVGPENIGARIKIQGLAAEVLPVALRTNDLLGRLGTALHREKRLAASAAHELRTPVAEVRAVAELMLLQDRSGPEYRQALEQIVTSCRAMGRKMSGLLVLARISSGSESPQLAPTDLCALFDALWARHITPLASRGITIAPRSISALPAVTILADSALLELLLENLLGNIAEYVSPQGRISCELHFTAGSETFAATRFVLRLTNTFPFPPTSGPTNLMAQSQPASFRDGHLGIGLQLISAAAAAMDMRVA